MSRLLRVASFMALGIALVAGCSAGGSAGKGGGISGAGSATGSGSAPGSGSATGSGSVTGAGSTTSGSGGSTYIVTDGAPFVTDGALPPGCSPEVCDGVDNDCNGIIDDVDVNHDGVCDCLLIATLGLAGTWGQGDVFATWLSARSNNGATSLADQTLTPALLKKYQVIVAQDLHTNHAYSSAEVQALHDWVVAGGGFMTLIGYADPTEVTNVNRLLASFGMNYGSTPILPASGGVTVPITTWATHPTTNQITAVGIDNGYEVQGAGTTIAQGGGYVVAKALDVPLGHVFVWGDEWITYNSEWQQHPDYQVQRFWLNVIKWLTPANQCQVAIPEIIK